VDPGLDLPDQALLRRLRQRRKEMLADVPLRERVEIPALQREVLDHRPVQRLRLLAEHGERRFQVVHLDHAARRCATTDSANRSIIDRSKNANGSEAGDTMSSSTPSASKSCTRARMRSGVPASAPSENSSSDWPSSDPPGVHPCSAS